MSRVCVIGTGYVGLTTGTCFADLGNDVICLDIDEAKIARLQRGELPIYEPGLEEVVARNVEAGRLRFTTSYAEAIPSAEFLATKISFINEIARVCDRLGADVKEVARGMGLDPRIAPAFLNAGLGWGGSCFPKDVSALEYMASTNGAHPQLLRAVVEINRDQRLYLVRLLRETLGNLRGTEIAVLGLAFKPNTDDMREAPSLEIVELLQHEGARVRAFD